MQSDGSLYDDPDSKVHGANMEPTWVLSSPGGPHVGPMNLAIWGWNRLGLGLSDTDKEIVKLIAYHITIINNNSIAMQF